MKESMSLDQAYERAVKLQAKNDFEGAKSIYLQLVKAIPEDVASHFNLGLIYQQQKKWNEAIACYKTVIKLNPEYTHAYVNLGGIYSLTKQFQDALAILQQGLAKFPDDIDIMNNLANLNAKLFRYQDAAKLFSACLKQAPKRLDIIYNFGTLLLRCGKVSEAITLFEQCYQVKSSQRHIIGINLINAYKQLGDINKTKRFCENLLKDYPDSALAFFNYADLQKFTTTDLPIIQHFLDLLKQDKFDKTEKEYLYFALGKIHHDTKNYKQAFNYYKKANQLRYCDDGKEVARLKNLTTALMKNKSMIKANIHPNPCPIFIVGMPRSGSTLVEQILAAHPRVKAGGELMSMENVLGKLSIETNNKAFPESLNEINIEIATQLAETYLTSIKPISENHDYITDKNPGNFKTLGLIGTMFKTPKVIICNRNPKDVCLSNYFQYYDYGQEYSYDLEDTVSYYKRYAKLMNYWRNNLNYCIYDLHYEKLVTDFDTQVQELLNYLGLDWHDDCRNFYKNKQAVSTASAWQVRQPIYHTAIEKWRAYEEYLYGNILTLD